MKALLLKIAIALQAFFLPFGAWGLLAIAFFDSAFLPLPSAIDVLVIAQCIQNPHLTWLYGLTATGGSVLGCLVLYGVARAGGHAAAQHRIGQQRLERIRNWFERHEMLTVMIPSIMPPPTPFKAVIITAGVTEVHLGKFILSLTIGRAIRYVGLGFLAVRYGRGVWDFAVHNGPLALGALVIAILIALLVMSRQRRLRIADAAGTQRVQA